METIEIEGQTFEVTGRDDNGTPTIRGIAKHVPHLDAGGNQLYDDEGNPVISVHVQAPAAHPVGPEEEVA